MPRKLAFDLSEGNRVARLSRDGWKGVGLSFLSSILARSVQAIDREKPVPMRPAPPPFFFHLRELDPPAKRNYARCQLTIF